MNELFMTDIPPLMALYMVFDIYHPTIGCKITMGTKTTNTSEMHKPYFEIYVCNLHVTNTTQRNESKLNTNDIVSHFASNLGTLLGYSPRPKVEREGT